VERIVVGIDGSPGADRALAWAVAEARQWSAHLEVVLAWSYLDQPSKVFKPDYGEADARASIEAAIERIGGAEGVDVTLTCVNDLPTRALIDAATRADHLVIGSRGLGGFKGLLLGSVSHQLAQHATVPVTIIHPEASPAQ
jgi:nucleotide-binding universal stress UspA family protein